MSQFTIRGTSADLPVFEEEAGLEPVSSLGTDAGLVSGFEFAEAGPVALDLEDIRLQSGRIRALLSSSAANWLPCGGRQGRSRVSASIAASCSVPGSKG